MFVIFVLIVCCGEVDELLLPNGIVQATAEGAPAPLIEVFVFPVEFATPNGLPAVPVFVDVAVLPKPLLTLGEEKKLAICFLS